MLENSASEGEPVKTFQSRTQYDVRSTSYPIMTAELVGRRLTGALGRLLHAVRHSAIADDALWSPFVDRPRQDKKPQDKHEPAETENMDHRPHVLTISSRMTIELTMIEFRVSKAGPLQQAGTVTVQRLATGTCDIYSGAQAAGQLRAGARLSCRMSETAMGFLRSSDEVVI